MTCKHKPAEFLYYEKDRKWEGNGVREKQDLEFLTSNGRLNVKKRCTLAYLTKCGNNILTCERVASYNYLLRIFTKSTISSKTCHCDEGILLEGKNVNCKINLTPTSLIVTPDEQHLAIGGINSQKQSATEFYKLQICRASESLTKINSLVFQNHCSRSDHEYHLPAAGFACAATNTTFAVCRGWHINIHELLEGFGLTKSLCLKEKVIISSTTFISTKNVLR